MKATINVNKASQYSPLNGMEFPVKESYDCKGLRIYALIGVKPEYPTSTVDFSEKELRNIH
jgi:hypothetical protein